MPYKSIVFQVKAYIKFLYYSKNQHGIHSPFVFALVTQCFYNNAKNEAYKTLKNIRNYLYTSYQTIYVTDFGAGSKVFKNNKRKVSAIAKNAGLSQKNSELLFRIVAYFKPTHILEIGTSVGLGTVSMALANLKTKIITLEGCPETAAVAQNIFKEFRIENIEITTDEFSKSLQKYSSETFDLIYFDGNHQQEATLHYFEALLPTITANSVWIFDDIHWSAGMEKAWEIIKNHPKVTVTIDTFQWGIAFFRTEQAKEHFVVRV